MQLAPDPTRHTDSCRTELVCLHYPAARKCIRFLCGRRKNLARRRAVCSPVRRACNGLQPGGIWQDSRTGPYLDSARECGPRATSPAPALRRRAVTNGWAACKGSCQLSALSFQLASSFPSCPAPSAERPPPSAHRRAPTAERRAPSAERRARAPRASRRVIASRARVYAAEVWMQTLLAEAHRDDDARRARGWGRGQCGADGDQR